ncbi:MAG: hypothetical protein ABIN67_10620 [Ferruginibacter sp.]
MKKLIFAFVAGFISVLVATSGLYARQLNFNANSDPAETALRGDSITPVGENADIVKNISTKALKSFSRSYKKGVNEKWSVIADGFAAFFMEDNVRTIVYYNTKGAQVGTLKGYAEDKMSPSLRDLVKRQYYDFKITYVNEVETFNSGGKPTYVINVEDEKHILQLRVNDGEIEIWKKYNKAP